MAPSERSELSALVEAASDGDTKRFKRWLRARIRFRMTRLWQIAYSGYRNRKARGSMSLTKSELTSRLGALLCIAIALPHVPVLASSRAAVVFDEHGRRKPPESTAVSLVRISQRDRDGIVGKLIFPDVLRAGSFAPHGHSSSGTDDIARDEKAAVTIVVRANGPSATNYPPGTRLPDNGTIVLKPGDSVTVLDAHGTRVLKGAGTVPVSGTGTASVNGLSALIADNGVRQTRTGATRGQTKPPYPTNVWMIDVTRRGPMCVINPKGLALWRPNIDTDASVTLKSGKASATIVFRAGQAVRPWPIDELPISDGTDVALGGLGADHPQVITLKLLPRVPATLDEAAVEILDAGCSAQFEMLADATATDPDGPPN